MNRAQYVALYERLARTKTRYSECIKITRTDGTVFRFTAHDNALNIWEEDGHRYEYTPAGSFQLTALETTAGLDVSNMDINAIITDDHITEDDLSAGRFDSAKVELFIAYWSNTQVGTLPLRVAWVGDMNVEGQSFKAELRGIAQKLAQVFIETTSLECRHDFCDIHYTRSYCTLDRATYEKSYTVTSVVGRSQFVCDIAPADYGKYAWGLATFTSGNNSGLEMEVTHNENGSVILFLNMPYDIEIGDTLTLLQGCDKRYATCVAYSNIANFGGEPFMAGGDMLNSYKLIQVTQGDGGKKTGGLGSVLGKK